MDRSSSLIEMLKGLCPNVYYQPPATISMKYPCIVVSLDRITARYADNNPYSLNTCYNLTYICRDPDNEMKYRLAQLSKCSFERAYSADNLHHYSFRLYY